MIGTTLGHFKVIARLSESRSGEVYRAEDEALRRHVVLKILSPALASDPDHKARFLNAARAAALVAHPHVAAVHEVGESEGRVWVAAELVEGPTLRDRLAGRPLPLLDTLRIGEQVAEGLAAAHERNLAHGDLRPEKVVLLPGGQVKVVDFGLGDTEPGAGAQEGGKAGNQPCDSRTDVYRLGAMLYEMATGRVPVPDGERTQPVSVSAPSLGQDPQSMTELDRIVAACLDPNPEDRYQSAGQLAVDLGNLRRRTETAPTSVPSSETAMAARRRALRRWAWAAASLALAMVLTVLGSWPWRHFRPAPLFKDGDRYIVADFVSETGDEELGLALRDFAGNLSGAVLLTEVPRPNNMDATALTAAAAETWCLKGECEGYVIGRVAPDPGGYRLEIAMYRSGRPEPVFDLSSTTPPDTVVDVLVRMIQQGGQTLHEEQGVGHNYAEGNTYLCPVGMSGGVNRLKAHRAEGRALVAESLARIVTLSSMAMELDPTNPIFRFNHGIWLIDAGRRTEGLKYMKEAAQAWSEAAEKHPECRSAALNTEEEYLARSWGYDALGERVNRAVQLFPDGTGFWWRYGEITERMLGNPAAGLPYRRKAYEFGKAKLPYWFGQLADALLRAGELNELDALIEDYRQVPVDPERVSARKHLIAIAQIGAAYLRGQDYEAIIAMIERLVGERELDAETARGFRAEALAMAGHLAEAEKWARGAKTGESSTAAMSGGGQANAHYGLLDWLEKRRTGKVRDLEPSEREVALKSEVTFNALARVSVEMGTARALRKVLATAEEEQKDNHNHLVVDAIQFSRSCVTLLEGRPKDAIAGLEPLARDNGAGSFLRPQQVLGRAYEAVGRWAEAARVYESVLKERRFWYLSDEAGVVFVLGQHRLAGIYERIGNPERARYWYGRFLNDWRSADPGTPEVEDAKKRLAALGGPLAAGT
jgi:tetratricopeptide (TPR) repeat protein